MRGGKGYFSAKVIIGLQNPKVWGESPASRHPPNTNKGKYYRIILASELDQAIAERIVPTTV